MQDRSAILLLGAGASLQAGLPSASAFIEAMIARIRTIDERYSPAASGSLINAVATDLESVFGSTELWPTAKGLVDPAFLAQPTDAHRSATNLFDVVVTTNYDLLLERALGDDKRAVVSGDTASINLNRPLIIKLHGSIDQPAGLVLTEIDLANVEKGRPHVWAALEGELRKRPLIAVGSSLRDPSIVRLLQSAQPAMRGWAVLYEVSAPDRVRLAHWGLKAIEGDTKTFLNALEHEIRTGT